MRNRNKTIPFWCLILKSQQTITFHGGLVAELLKYRLPFTLASSWQDKVCTEPMPATLVIGLDLRAR